MQPGDRKNVESFSVWCQMMVKASGFFVTFEGADGVGKTTQTALLRDFLLEDGFCPLLTREPGGTSTGERVRDILLDPDCDMGMRAEALLYLAVRAEHVDKIVQPALVAGKVVISDRFSDSTLVYQGFGRGLPMSDLAAINSFAAIGIEPDLTFVLDAPAQLLAERMQERGTADRMEKQGLDFQKVVREGFLALAEQSPKRMVVIDATEEIGKIQQEIRAVLKERLLVCNRFFAGCSDR